MTKTDGPQHILNNVTPCRCGCKGRDPWHKSWYRRVVRDIKDLPNGGREGLVRMPYSTQPVRVFQGTSGSSVWTVDKDSIEHDKN